MAKFDCLVVGAGFAGSVVAERLATAGRKVHVIDRRGHIGGNAYDAFDAHGILIHQYGPHIFHTNAKRVIEHLSAFTNWRFYEHRVLASVAGDLYPMPINRTTINKMYGLNLDEAQVQEFFESAREKRDPVRTSEDVVLNSVGRDLYEKFFLNYTKKQWGLDPSRLSAGVAARVPARTNNDDRYFQDDYQFMPAAGYTKMFEAMMDQPNISIELGVDFEAMRTRNDWNHLVYTGPIDAYFSYEFGKLPYRSLVFEHDFLPSTDWFQSVGTVNYPNDHAYTRITEFKHLTGQRSFGTSIVREYPTDTGEPYYPIPRPENEALYKRYVELANQEQNVTFVGRLAQYRYYNMDQVVAAALKAADRILGRS